MIFQALSAFNCLNPFQHTDAFWCHCRRRILKTLWHKLNFVNSEQCILLSQCFQLYSIIYRGAPYFLLHVFKVVWCRFVLCGKEFINTGPSQTLEAYCWCRADSIVGKRRNCFFRAFLPLFPMSLKVVCSRGLNSLYQKRIKVTLTSSHITLHRNRAASLFVKLSKAWKKIKSFIM